MLHGWTADCTVPYPVTTITSASGRWAFDVPESFETTRSGEPEVEQDGIDGLGLEQAISLFGGVGYMRHEPERAGDFAAGFPDRAFIVDDEKVEIIGGHNLSVGIVGLQLLTFIRVIPSDFLKCWLFRMLKGMSRKSAAAVV